MDLITSLCDPLPPRMEPRPIGPSVSIRMQALFLAIMNRERAEACASDQEALAEFLRMNERFLLEVAK